MRPLAIIFVAALVVPAPAAIAGEPLLACPAVAVLSRDSGVQIAPEVAHSASGEGIEVDYAAHRTAKVTVQGPMLGAMDSRDVRTELACATNGGLLLTATITRAESFSGSALNNEL